MVHAQVISVHVAMYGAPWMYVSWWLVLQGQSWTRETRHVLCNHSVPKYNFWCTEWFYWVKWSWTCSQCDGQSCDSESFTCDIGLVERKVCSGDIAIFCFQSKTPRITISLWTEYFELVLWFYLQWKTDHILCWIQVYVYIQVYEYNTVYKYLI